MFQVDDVIIYGTQGVCRITGMEEKTVSGTKKTYFVWSRSMSIALSFSLRRTMPMF